MWPVSRASPAPAMSFLLRPSGRPACGPGRGTSRRPELARGPRRSRRSTSRACSTSAAALRSRSARGRVSSGARRAVAPPGFAEGRLERAGEAGRIHQRRLLEAAAQLLAEGGEAGKIAGQAGGDGDEPIGVGGDELVEAEVLRVA